MRLYFDAAYVAKYYIGEADSGRCASIGGRPNLRTPRFGAWLR